MSLDIFLVESPLQCLNAAEAAFKLSNKKTKFLFVRLNEVESNNEQIRLVVSQFNWDYVYYDRIENGVAALKLLKFFLFSCKIYQSTKGMNVSTIYFGDFRSYWMDCVRRSFNHVEQFLLDDGDITLSIVENYLRKKQSSFFTGPIKYLSALITFRLNFNLNMPKLFSSFDIPDYCGVVENKFEFLKSKVSTLNESESGLIYFFGSRYSEEGILSLESEIEMLKTCVYFLRNSYNHVVYVPHRGDSAEKLLLVSTFVEIKRFGMPAEIFLATTNLAVDSIAGCCTSALNNLNSIFKYKEIVSFKLQLDDIDQKYRDDFRLTYNSYEKLGFRIIDLQNI